MFVLVAILPYKTAGVIESPFVAVLDQIGIPFAADIMNFVILTAILSVANSGLYAASRMMWSLSSNQMGPSFLTRLTKRRADECLADYTRHFRLFTADKCHGRRNGIFMVYLNLRHGDSCRVDVHLCFAIFFRRRFLAEGGNVNDLEFRTPLYPLVPILGFGLYACVLISLIFIPDQRIGLYCGVPIIIFCYAYYHLSLKNV